MPNFIQLSKEDCTYLLDLIEEMDSETLYTARQRSYTVPKLKKISENPNFARLHMQDVEYLLDLIEDDDLLEAAEQRESTKAALLEIQELQLAKFQELKTIEQQREQRRNRRISLGPHLKLRDSE